MRKTNILLAIATLALASCQDSPDTPRNAVDQLEAATDRSNAAANPAANAAANSESDFGFWQAQSSAPWDFRQGPSAESAARSAQRNAASGAEEAATTAALNSQIAYAYSWGFRVAADDLATLQQRHMALCDAMGDECRVLRSSQSGDGEFAYGRMRLQVAASKIDSFSEHLTANNEDLNAEQISFAMDGEDLTENIIDTEARIAARLLLRDRLMEVLRNRQGSIGDLVEAERGVAEVNEEIDASQSRLQTLRNRVAFTSVTIEYDPAMGQYRLGFWKPVSEALASITSTFGVAVAAAIYLVVGALPFVVLFFGLRWLWRRSGMRFRRKKATES